MAFESSVPEVQKDIPAALTDPKNHREAVFDNLVLLSRRGSLLSRSLFNPDITPKLSEILKLAGARPDEEESPVECDFYYRRAEYFHYRFQLAWRAEDPAAIHSLSLVPIWRRSRYSETIYQRHDIGINIEIHDARHRLIYSYYPCENPILERARLVRELGGSGNQWYQVDLIEDLTNVFLKA